MRADRLVAAVALAATLMCTGAGLGQSYVNWESPHVNPLDLAPDGTRLLAVNTADNRLEVFTVAGAGLVHAASVPVGLDPVSVRARTATEAWVVNHVSDTISVVDLDTLNVRATIATGDEPTDVVFAGDPERAFVSVSQLNEIRVYDPSDLAAAPTVIAIEGEDPRALATDGTRVFAAIFQAGNGTTILSETAVSSGDNPYAGDPNPPPNAGSGFDPPIDGGLPLPPETSLIVKRTPEGVWEDENGGDWSAAVDWDLHGHDIAVIDAGTLAVEYVTGLLNANMNLAVSPGGTVAVVGLEATNDLRFEPNLRGTFVRVTGATFTPPATTPLAFVDLNPHLDYTTATVDQSVRDESIGDPRGVAWNGSGDRIYVTGLGSNNLVVTDAGLARVGRVETGPGPTGVVVNDAESRVYVLNRFDGSISIVDPVALIETGRIGFFDPTPETIRLGRPHLYDTHRTSGLGQVSCASCHIDARMDQVGWDLGDPTGEMKDFNQVCNFGLAGGCEDWHPMKGPMTTQTLIGIIGTEPLHWRGDREDVAAFNGAFESLLGDDEQLTPDEMDEFTDFLATLTYPPNPNRNIDGSLKNTLGNGSPTQGSILFTQVELDAGAITCDQCHALPTGTNGELTSADLILEAQSMKIPQLRNMHEKTGFSQSSANNNRGFGYTHDGNVESVLSFLDFPGFTFSGGPAGVQQRRNIVAFMMSLSTDTHAGVGVQATIGGDGVDQTALRDELMNIAADGDVGLVVKGVVAGEPRGYYATDLGVFQSDRVTEVVTVATLDAGAGPGAELTYTLVPLGSEVRIGVDRDEDGHFDQDEIDGCTDPTDADSFPGNGGGGCGCVADVDGTGDVGFSDVLAILAAWGPCGGCVEDLDDSGDVGFADLILVLAAWGPCP